MDQAGQVLFHCVQAKGFNVIALQNPLTSLADDVAATKRAIALMDGPILLVGHLRRQNIHRRLEAKTSWMIIGTEDHMVIPQLARAEAAMIKAKTTELKSSHVPMLSMPEKVVAVIMDAAK